MRSPKNWADRPTRSLLVALPLLALLLLAPSRAFACGESSSEITYCASPPSIESGESIKHSEPKPSTTHHHTKPNASPTAEEPTEATSEPEGHRSHAAPPAKGGNQPPGGGKPKGHASPKPSAVTHQDPGKTVAAKSVGPSSSGVKTSGTGGSSPVLPILVAIVVLAAISIGVVVYRERRRGDRPPDYTGARG